MRTPTPPEELYAYWFLALKNIKAVSIHPNDPEVGFYKTRLVKDGPWVPVAIWMVQHVNEAGELIADEELRCKVNDCPEDPYKVWTWCANRPITEEEYRYHIKYGRWAEEWKPEDPAARPRQAMNVMTSEPAF